MPEFAILVILAFFAAVYAGYPLLILALASVRRGAAPALGQAPRSVSIVICAHNEAAVLGAKLSSVFAAVAGRTEAIEIVLCDDGSTDGTTDAVAAVAGDSPAPLRLMRLPRGGKAAALVRAMEVATGEILVFSDADPLWEKATLGALIEPFRDPRVGAVAGEIRSMRKTRWHAGEALFRAYESAIRSAEDRLFGCVSADGGLFALRAELAEPVPADVTDDFFLSTGAVARGLRIAFCPQAAVYETAAAGQRQHFRRRIRITVRGLAGLWRRRALLDPRRTGAYAVGLLFHKLLRRLAPVLLLPLWAMMLALVLERGEPLAIASFAGLSAAAAGTALVLLLPVSVPKLLRLPAWLAVHIGGLAIGTLLFLLGKRYSQWAPQER